MLQIYLLDSKRKKNGVPALKFKNYPQIIPKQQTKIWKMFDLWNAKLPENTKKMNLTAS